MNENKRVKEVRPILRWAGSKRKIVPKLLSLMPERYSRYVEPFCGSACLFLEIDTGIAVLADRNPHLISAYEAVRDEPAEVAKKLSKWKPTKEVYLKLRSEGLGSSDKIHNAAQFIFLNRYCFNGVYRENNKGIFNVPYAGKGTGKLPDENHLIEFSEKLKHVDLICSDFEGVVEKCRRGDFLYLDPPYHYERKKNRGEYGFGAFSENDIDRFIGAVKVASDKGVQILISYNKAHLLKRELPGWALSYSQVRRSVAGFAEKRQVVREYQLRNY